MKEVSHIRLYKQVISVMLTVSYIMWQFPDSRAKN